MEDIKFRKGPQVYIRPVLESDLEKVVVWINDPDITQFLASLYPLTMADERSWYERLSKDRTKVVFAICLTEDIGDHRKGEIIGIMGLHKIDHLHGTAETGSFIGCKDLWGQGLGTEAKMLVLDYAFNTLNLRKIYSSTYSFNKRSEHCLKKCGYVKDGVRIAHRFRDGKYWDEHQWAVFREGYEAAKRKLESGSGENPAWNSD